MEDVPACEPVGAGELTVGDPPAVGIEEELPEGGVEVAPPVPAVARQEQIASADEDTCNAVSAPQAETTQFNAEF